MYATISQIKERAVAFARGFLYDKLWLAFSNRIVSKSRQKVNLAAALSALIGCKMLKKQFEKAGITK